ncbi:DUF6457 domain-containing protein [Zafaria sp. Z1313]|uniref:DUF6457 domain-containing protein n=1 Tax=unclassified Zafaria TaxID=2828765 RepID=UPI002E770FC5|nr:DUF6457 domain-containing protein [Zafaria sp. J156]MEE1622253.1 DUF6457 domain-containing protein [Zafaria sp. J156]
MAGHPELQEWAAELLERFELAGTEIDIDAVLSLAGLAAHGIVRPAAPVTTYIAGFAAGLAAGHGMASESGAMAAADRLARAVLAERASREAAPEGGDAPGGTGPGATA